jgi:hypothetical protein
MSPDFLQNGQKDRKGTIMPILTVKARNRLYRFIGLVPVYVGPNSPTLTKDDIMAQPMVIATEAHKKGIQAQRDLRALRVEWLEMRVNLR